MRIAICDDCMEDIRTLKSFLGRHEVSVYSGADKFLEDIEEKNILYDLYLIDIYLDGGAGDADYMEEPGMNGIELARRLREHNEEAAICFVSASDDFYREAYDLYAVQYLIKPVQKEAIEQLLEKVSKNLVRKKEQKLSFQYRGQSGKIPYGKILYIMSREHTLSIHCTDGTVQECRGKLSELAMRICGEIFMRCHQSVLVNMYYVDNLKGAELTVAGQSLPVSRRYYADVKKRYQEILFEEVD